MRHSNIYNKQLPSHPPSSPLLNRPIWTRSYRFWIDGQYLRGSQVRPVLVISEVDIDTIMTVMDLCRVVMGYSVEVVADQGHFFECLFRASEWESVVSAKKLMTKTQE